MEFTTSYCPNPQCTHYGQRCFGAHLVRRGADRGIPRLLCTRCEGTFWHVRVRRTLGYVQRSRITPSRCGLWPKVILYGVPAASSRSIRILSVTGWIELGAIVGP